MEKSNFSSVSVKLADSSFCIDYGQLALAAILDWVDSRS